MKNPLVNTTVHMNQYGDEALAQDFNFFSQSYYQVSIPTKNNRNGALTSLPVEHFSPIKQLESDGCLIKAIESKLLPSDLLSSEDEQENEEVNSNSQPRTGSSTRHSESLGDSFSALSGSNNSKCTSSILQCEHQLSRSSSDQNICNDVQTSICDQKKSCNEVQELADEQSLIYGVNSIFSQEIQFTPFQFKEYDNNMDDHQVHDHDVDLTALRCQAAPFTPILAEQSVLLPKNPETQEQQKASQGSNRHKNKNSQYKFPDGGWECSRCHNYNFKGRKECKRCKKPKTAMDQNGIPEHMTLEQQEKAAIKKQKTKEKRQRKVQQVREAKTMMVKQEMLATEYPQMKQMTLKELTQQLKNQKRQKENYWECQRCSNRNYSFRNECNICHLPLQENDAILMMNNQQNLPMPKPFYPVQNSQATK